MDKLDSAITALRIEIDKDERAIAEKKVRLAALVEAAEMRPAVSRPETLRRTNVDAAVIAHQRSRAAAGRAPGSIAAEWREYLGEVVAHGNPSLPKSQFVTMAAQRLNKPPATVRQRVRQFIIAGHLAESDDGVCVSEAAIERFRLRKMVKVQDGDESYPRSESSAHNATAPH